MILCVEQVQLEFDFRKPKRLQIQGFLMRSYQIAGEVQSQYLELMYSFPSNSAAASALSLELFLLKIEGSDSMTMQQHLLQQLVAAFQRLLSCYLVFERERFFCVLDLFLFQQIIRCFKLTFVKGRLFTGYHRHQHFFSN